MRITPTIVVESMPKALAAGLFRAPDTLPKVRALLADAVCFQFPDVHGIDEHCAFAVDLHERGLFKLPFPATAVSIERDLGPPYGRRGAMIVLIEQEGGAIGCLSCLEADDGGVAIPIAISNRATFNKVADHSCDVYGNTAPLVADHVLSAMYGGDGQSVLNTLHQRVMSNVLNGMGMVVLLMSRGVSTERIAAPDKLNKARAKRGKPPINDRYVVTVDMLGSRTICNADGSTDDITGHVRGAPRMHWRRGHFRTLYRGTEREQVVPVAPCLVSANEAAEPIRKEYRVRQREPAA